MHACPNQHLVPLLAHVVPRFGADGFLLGSNYIWGWETNRVARDLIADAGGKVLGERYLPLGETDVSRLIAEIQATRPDFILNNLIGPSSYAFLAAYAATWPTSDPHFRPERCPVLSCNLTECELPAIGEAGNGHLVGRAVFSRRPRQPARRPHAGLVLRGGRLCLGAGAGRSPRRAIPRRGWTDLSKAFAGRRFSHPARADIAIDPQTQHATLAGADRAHRGTASSRPSAASDERRARSLSVALRPRPRHSAARA